MRLHIIYRSSAVENMKARPAYYSKLACLKSFLQAVSRCNVPPEIVYLNDGDLPDDRLQVMAATGDVVSLPALRPGASGGSRRAGIYRSYTRALSLVDERGWPDDDLVYLAEDDYLYLPEALASLVLAAEQLTIASYFSFYATIIWSRTHGFWVNDELWHTAESTTSSFAARIGTLRADRLIHRVAFNVGHDTQVCLSYQGIRPYRWAYILGDLLGNDPAGKRRLKSRASTAAAQCLVNLLATRASLRRRVLVCPARPLATHVELPYIAAGDWAAAAEEAARWAAASSLPHLPSNASGHDN
jgi:hypothetical protein